MKGIKMLQASKKSMKYAKEVKGEDYIDNQSSTVLNMRTVKEGTAFAGGFANWLFEISRNNGLDLITARKIGDLIQQESLDSKHTIGGNGFADSKWFKIVNLRKTSYKKCIKEIEEEIKSILNEKEESPVINQDYNEDFQM